MRWHLANAYLLDLILIALRPQDSLQTSVSFLKVSLFCTVSRQQISLSTKRVGIIQPKLRPLIPEGIVNKATKRPSRQHCPNDVAANSSVDGAVSRHQTQLSGTLKTSGHDNLKKSSMQVLRPIEHAVNLLNPSQVVSEHCESQHDALNEEVALWDTLQCLDEEEVSHKGQTTIRSP